MSSPSQMVPSLPKLLFCLSISLSVVSSHWSQHYRHYRKHDRRKRQQFGLSPEQTVELNFSVPFIFSARVYPYGEKVGDSFLEPSQQSQAFVLKNTLTYFGSNFSTLYITKDGAIAFSPDVVEYSDERFPRGPKVIAPYWTPVSLGDTGRVYFRESFDNNTLSIASNEVQIQYGYAESFKPSSVVIVTWENVAPPGAPADLSNEQRNLFQVALILSTNGSFAHMVYSKLRWNDRAVAGFNEGDGYGYFSLPGSGTPEALKLANESDIGIPGEWMFKIDHPQIYLCGPGFKGIECIHKCSEGEYYYDCTNRCHCSERSVCNSVNGHCPGGGADTGCAKGWTNPPSCDIDEDECEETGSERLCDANTPDCINTPGSYICTCLTGFDNSTNTCRGIPAPIEIQVVPNQPDVIFVPPDAGANGGIRFIPVTQSRAPEIGGGTTRKASKSQFITATTPKPAETTRKPGPVRPGPPLTLKAVLPLRTTTLAPEQLDVSEQRVDASQRESAVIVLETFPPRSQPTEELLLVGSSRGPTINSFVPLEQTIIPDHPEIPINPTSAETIPVFESSISPSATSGLATVEETTPAEACSLSCGPRAGCRVVAGTPTCTCNPGYTGDGFNCEDINECFLDGSCDGTARCENTQGSYTCICAEGFIAEGNECVDIDECAEGLASCPGGNTSQCVNTYGGHECSCRPGFNGNPTSILGCIDINECLIPEFYCGQNARCENILGGFRCHCNDGFKQNHDGTACEDINECAEADGPCAPTARCSNQPGSFACQCLDGFAGDGFICSESRLYPYSPNEDKKLESRPDSWMEIQLTRPLRVLAKDYQSVYISCNGLITVDKPVTAFVDQPLGNMTNVGFAPLYQKVNLEKSGKIYIRQTADFNLLQRSSLSISEDFNDPAYQAENLVIITFEDIMRQMPNSQEEPRSQYQVIISAGAGGSYITVIYDEINTVKAQAGIMAPHQELSYILPGSGGDVRELAQSTNVGSPGKWIFRVDLPQIISCPAGYTGPPYCHTACTNGTWGVLCANACRCIANITCAHDTGLCPDQACSPGFTGLRCDEDIDECGADLAQCHSAAICTNYPGSYGCTCGPGWTGDGVNCSPLDYCLAAGLACSPQAQCITSPDGSTVQCRCAQGFSGDGFTCTPIFLLTTESSDVFTEPIVPDSVDSNVVDSSPAVPIEIVPSVVPESRPVVPSTHFVYPAPSEPSLVTTPPIDIHGNQLGEKEVSTVHSTPYQPEFIDNRIDSEPSLSSAVGRSQEERRPAVSSKSSSSSSLLVIVIPAVLCGIWLVLIIVLLIVCLRRRKQRQREKYGLGYYMAPSHMKGGAASTLSANAYPYGSAASAWSIPRVSYEHYAAAAAAAQMNGGSGNATANGADVYHARY